MLLVKRELWRGPLSAPFTQLPEIAAGMALAIGTSPWDEGGGRVEAREEIGSNRGRTVGQWPWILCRNTALVFSGGSSAETYYGPFRWFLLNPFIILRMGQSPEGIHKYSHFTHWLKNS